MTKEQILEKVGEATRSTPAGQWISGSGWDEGFFNPAVFPTATDLDAVSPNHPVVLERIDGHSSWVDSLVLKSAAISRNTPDPAGGRIVRNGAKDATGIIVDRAQDLVSRVTPRREWPTDRERRIRTALFQYTRWGVTSVHDAGTDLETIAIYKKLLAAGELPIRVYAMARGAEPVRHYLARGPEINIGEGRLSVRSFKILLDGALGSRGAELADPYSDMPAFE